MFIGITEEQINQALKNIYNRVVDTTKEIEPTLFKHAQQNLNKSVDMAFGSVEFGTPDYDFVNQLKNNNAVFAAFKTHREQNDLIPKLWDDKGKLRSFEEFKKANKHIVSKYDHWLRTEYNTAVVRARNASNFKKFNRDADLYPNLEWLPSTSIEPRDEHRKFYGLVLPINDPFWQTHYPGNLWNCKCGITNTDKEPSKRTPTANYTPPQGLEENPASSGALFSNKNMYVKNAYRGAEEAVERHILKERRIEIREIAKEKFLNKKIELRSINKTVEFSTKGIKEVINQPHKHYIKKNEAILNIEELILKSTLHLKNVKDKDKPNVRYHYLKTTIANETSYIVLKEDISVNRTRLYSIVDSIRKRK